MKIYIAPSAPRAPIDESRPRLAVAIKLLGALVLTLGLTFSLPLNSSASFSFNWLGVAASPRTYVSDGSWDVSVHKRGSGSASDPSAAGHAADCTNAGPTATHLVTQLQDMVYICNNHLMTSISDKGYGQIDLTPNQLLDFSSGTAKATVKISTVHSQARSWLVFWITPWGEIEQHPFTDAVDLQGPPKDGVEIRMCFCSPAQTRFDAFVYTNYVGAALASQGVPIDQVVPTSVVTRTPFELDISRTHLRFGMPDQQNWFVDTAVNLPFSSGALQFGHHDYDSCKDQAISPASPCQTMDTWHWSDVTMSPTIPFTQIPGDNHYANKANPVANFAQAAPANAFLRFEELGPGLTASYNGAPPVALSPMANLSSHEDHFAPYWLPVPAGTTTIRFNALNCYCGNWEVRDASIWSLTTVGGGPTPTPTAAPTPTTTPGPTPTPTATPTPVPTPISMSSFPCTVTYPDGSQHVGICSGTFTPH